MIIKFFKRWLWGAGIEYLLEDPTGYKQPIIVSGNPDIVQSTIDSTVSVNPKTAGVLSFQQNIDDESLEEIIDLAEMVMFPGLEKDRYSILWVKHLEPTSDGKGRTGLHFVTANKDLKTGKIIQPYYDNAHRPLWDAFQELINIKYNFVSPKDPERVNHLNVHVADQVIPDSTKKKAKQTGLEIIYLKISKQKLIWAVLHLSTM